MHVLYVFIQMFFLPIPNINAERFFSFIADGSTLIYRFSARTTNITLDDVCKLMLVCLQKMFEDKMIFKYFEF